MTTYSSKRLAKNTLMMYFRMGVSMIVGLISTKVVFNILGVDNYGLYDVVAGVIVLFSFISSALSTATQRYFSYELGKGNTERLVTIYNATFRIYIIVSLIIFIFAESVGLWFLNYQMVFPKDSLLLANFVYQFSILTTIINVFRVPYNAAIVSCEKFEFYAYTSIFEAIIKLGFVFSLYLIPSISTYAYAVILFFIAVIMLIWYYIYCKRNFDFITFAKKVDKNMFMEILSFSGWGFFGALCNMGYRQGVNIVINIFYGVIFNAAFGIANQISVLVNQFVSGFQSSYNPQLTKTCAAGTPQEQDNIIALASKISFSLLLIIGLCAIFNIDLILTLWLGNTPNATSSLCILMISAAIVDSISDPFWIVIFATGKIRSYQLLCALLMIGNILLTIYAFHCGLPVQTCMYIRILMNVGILLVRLIITKKQTDVSINKFFKNVLIKDLWVLLLLMPIISCIYVFSHGYIRLFVSTPLFLILAGIIQFYILLNKSERDAILNLIKQKIKK